MSDNRLTIECAGRQRKLDFSGGTLVMGILNVTPDSFSDGGEYLSRQKAVEHGKRMFGEGAAVVDIGPESSRPGSKPVSADEQIRRAVGVIELLARDPSAVISIDTRLPEAAETAIKAGACVINDISGFAEPGMAELAADTGAAAVIMHMLGDPATMQKDPRYDNVVDDVLAYLLERAEALEKAGVKSEMIFIDPGIGFGKTLEHNVALLKNIDKFAATGFRVLVGASRKSFIGTVTGKAEPAERLIGSVTAAVLAAKAGASMVRVHDVPQTSEALRLTNALSARVV